MDCPECGGPVDAYALGGREASICAHCGWVGIEADHRGEGVGVESWDDALDRFYERHVETERRRADLPPVAAATGTASDADGAADADGDDTDGEGGERDADSDRPVAESEANGGPDDVAALADDVESDAAENTGDA